MTKAQRIAAAWAGLPASELTDQVRLLVKARDVTARGVWAAVREDPVVAARVRGALAGLKAEYRGHRDEAMWLVWITHVQQQLAVQATPVPAAPAAVEPDVEVDFGTDFNPGFGSGAETAPEPNGEWAAQAPAVPRPPSDAPPVLFQEPMASSS